MRRNTGIPFSRPVPLQQIEAYVAQFGELLKMSGRQEQRARQE